MHFRRNLTEVLHVRCHIAAIELNSAKGGINRVNERYPDVELEKNSSGTWTAARSRGHSFKPWQRLWVAVGVIYAILIAGSFCVLMPDQESIERRMVFSVTEEVRRYDGMAFAGEAPRKVFESARSMGYPAWLATIRTKYRIGPDGDAGFGRIEKKYRDELGRLPAQRVVGVIFCIIAWLVPMSLLYGFGYMVDWIRRGGRGIVMP